MKEKAAHLTHVYIKTGNFSLSNLISSLVSVLVIINGSDNKLGSSGEYVISMLINFKQIAN